MTEPIQETVYQALFVAYMGGAISAFIVPFLLALNIRGIRDRLLSTPISKVPGFRSGRTWRVVASSFACLIILAGASAGLAGLFVTSGDTVVSDVSLSTGEVQPGEPVNISAVVENGVGNDTLDVALLVDGATRETRTIEIGSSETRSITFEQVFDEAGTYEIQVNGEAAGEVRVGGIVVGDSQVSSRDVEVGESVDVEIPVENAGEFDDSTSISLSVDGSVVDETEVSLDGGETQTVFLSHSFDSPGEYEIAVNGGSLGTITVNEEPTTVSPSDDEYYMDLVATTLETGDFDVSSIEIEDDRPNDGDESVLVSARTSSTTVAGLASDIGAFTGTFAGAVGEGWNIDAMVVVLENEEGTPVGTFHIEGEWAQQYENGEISQDEYTTLVLQTWEPI